MDSALTGKINCFLILIFFNYRPNLSMVMLVVGFLILAILRLFLTIMTLIILTILRSFLINMSLLKRYVIFKNQFFNVPVNENKANTGQKIMPLKIKTEICEN